MKGSRAFLWLLILIPIALGLSRLRLDVEILDLLPADVPAVRGLHIYQREFANAGELVVTLRTTSAEDTEGAARAVAEALRGQTNAISSVMWEPPWQAHPDQVAELIGYLWLNQPPALFGQQTNRLAETNLPALLLSTRDQLATSMSPTEMAQLSYDPLGLLRLPEGIGPSAGGFGQGQEMFASSDGTFRMIFVQARPALRTYLDCARWLAVVRGTVDQALAAAGRKPGEVVVGYTGRPAFVAEIAGNMEREITGSVVATALIIAVLFWLAHRRWRPMLWLLILLAVILFSTLALGGLIFGTINVISMGFAAILLGLAVDYAVVHYQEALAHPGLSIPQVRREIAPSIFWAAVTTISAFLVLNFGGLPGLAQLGSLVALGVGISALVMIFAYLPPLFPERRKAGVAHQPAAVSNDDSGYSGKLRLVRWVTSALVFAALSVLVVHHPSMDPSADALRPRRSPAYSALEEIKAALGQRQEPLWLIVSGNTVSEVQNKLDRTVPILNQALSNQVVSGLTLPTVLWPRLEYQQANRSIAGILLARRDVFHRSAAAAGFSEQALRLTDAILDTWQRAVVETNVFWPTNEMSRWILGKLIARSDRGLFALGLIYPQASPTKSESAAVSELSERIDREGGLLTGWPLLGRSVFTIVQANLWKLVVPMVALVLASIWFAFRRVREVLLSLAVLALSGIGLLSVMSLAGWSWNLLNLMALPLVLGTGVDYSIFMQLALRRHHGNLRVAYQSVGRALLLCGGTAVAGFGSLAFSSNAGMASLGRVCSVGIAFNVIISVLLLPFWWKGARSCRSGPER